MSELALLLDAVAAEVDELSADFERTAADTTLTGASLAGLVENAAYLYGVTQEAGALGDQLRGYLIGLAQADGTPQALVQLLLFLLLTPVNLEGTELVFPLDGSGFTFPLDGNGIRPLFQHTAETEVGITLPASFPDQAVYFPADGAGLKLPLALPDVPDLAFGAEGIVTIDEDFPNHLVTVTVKSYLAFDRPAFKRALARYRQSHLLPFVYAEINY